MNIKTFAEEVYRVVGKIPGGETLSYKEVAERARKAGGVAGGGEYFE